MKSYTLDKKDIDKLMGKIRKPLKNMRGFFSALGVKIDQQAQVVFRTEGVRGGSRPWASFSASTLKTPKGSWNIRYGTDLSGRPGMQGQYRKGVRRYSGSSKLLQASGLFRESFKILKVSKNSMMFGTRHKLAEKIMSVKNRQVLFVTSRDRQEYSGLLRNYYLKGLQL